MQGTTGPCCTTHSAILLRSTTPLVSVGPRELGSGRLWLAGTQARRCREPRPAGALPSGAGAGLEAGTFAATAGVTSPLSDEISALELL
jgi:hypothetical protein